MKKILTLVLAITMLVMTLTACSGGTESSLAEDATLQISGAGLDINYTAEDMAELPTETINTENVSSSGEVTETEIVAISLKTILEENGINLDDMNSVELGASDGYAMTATQEEYAGSDIYIIIGEDGEGLEYPRSAIPEKRAMFWVKYLNSITLDGDASAGATEIKDISEISFFQSGISQLDSENIICEEEEYEAYSVKGYYDEYVKENVAGSLMLVAQDGLTRGESADMFSGSYVTLDDAAENTPFYFAEDGKNGMQVKELKYSVLGDSAVYYGDEIKISELFDELKVIEGDTYVFIAADGFEVEIPADAIESGTIKVEDGKLVTDFGDYDLSSTPGKGQIKDLLTIKAK